VKRAQPQQKNSGFFMILPSMILPKVWPCLDVRMREQGVARNAERESVSEREQVRA